MRLTQSQIDDFWRDGYLLVEDAVTPRATRRAACGDPRLGRAEPRPYAAFRAAHGRRQAALRHGAEHCAAKPALRRINNPSDISMPISR